MLIIVRNKIVIASTPINFRQFLFGKTSTLKKRFPIANYEVYYDDTMLLTLPLNLNILLLYFFL